MLGESISDPEGVESSEPHSEGLKLLPLRTRFSPTKVTAQVLFNVGFDGFWGTRGTPDLQGYEIHMGIVEQTRSGVAPLEIVSRNGTAVRIADGAVDENGTVMGTMIHGLFENDALREHVIGWLRRRKGIEDQPPIVALNKLKEYDRLARAVRANLDWSLISRTTGLSSLKLHPEPLEVQPA